MPFDSNGKFTLVGGNPVIPGSKISSTWANNTLADIANALSQTMIRRSGTVAPMHLNNDQAGFLAKLGIDTTLSDMNNRLRALEAESRAGIGIMEFVGHQNLARFSGNYLICDGRTVSRTEYADLFAVIGTTWGIGNGATTFNLPDMRGVVPRGFDNGRGFDLGRAFGSTQQDDYKLHNHTPTEVTTSGAHTHTYQVTTPGGGAGAGTGNGFINTWRSTGTGGSHTHSITLTATGGVETRMKNVAALWVIKYKSGGDVQLLNALTSSSGDNLINPLGTTLTGGVII